MKIKLLLFGEAANVPYTKFGLGVTFVAVWIDGNGFTSASNDLGSLGYAFIETPEIDIGQVDEERASIFRNLHNRTVSYQIKSNTFVKSGGLVRVKMTVAVAADGGLDEKSLEFQASDCRGICLVSNPISFDCEMYQQENPELADASQEMLPDEDLAALDSSSPSEGVA